MIRFYTKGTFMTSKTEDLRNIDLEMSYQVAALTLQECALHEPGSDLKRDAEITALEYKLLSLQEDILEKTTKFEISNDEDFRVIKSLWESAKCFKQTDDMNLLDRLAFSLFQYAEQNR